MSVNDTVVDEKYEELRASHNPKVVDTYVTVKANAFAVGKQVRDIFWPAWRLDFPEATWPGP